MINYIYEFYGGVILKKIVLFTLMCILLCGCGQSPAVNTKFETDINTFCTNVSDIDLAINQITNQTVDEKGLETATAELLSYLDLLNDEFSNANVDVAVSI